MAKSSGGSAKREDPSARLFNLTLALVQSIYGLTKAEIFHAVGGYETNVGGKSATEAQEKKFERDKEILRSMGIRIESAGSSDGDADYRYRISRDIYIWPEGTQLSGRQFQLLELASRAWDHSALSSAATNGITRLRAIADAASESITGLTPRISTVEPCFAPIKKAIEAKTNVKFTYRKADGSESVREVIPWQLSHTHGLWILIAWDLKRKEVRNFLLKRIHSEVKRGAEEFTAPTVGEIKAAKDDLHKHFKKNVAKLKIKPGTTAAMHFESHKSKDGVVKVNYLDLQLLAEELLEFGNSVSVLEPAALLKTVRDNLRQVIKNHA